MKGNDKMGCLQDGIDPAGNSDAKTFSGQDQYSPVRLREPRLARLPTTSVAERKTGTSSQICNAEKPAFDFNSASPREGMITRGPT
jgi:hypothetical protein